MGDDPRAEVGPSGRHPAGLADAAARRRVGLQHGRLLAGQRLRGVERAVEVLAVGDGHRRAGDEILDPGPLVLGERLLEPAHVEGVQPVGDLQRGRQGEDLAAVDHQLDRRAQEVAQLGRLRALVLCLDEQCECTVVVKPRAPYPRLVVGVLDNRLYIADHHGLVLPREYEGAMIVRTDYDARKGADSAYWYHDHEPEYPTIRLLSGGRPQYRGGSYVVAPEGITG